MYYNDNAKSFNSYIDKFPAKYAANRRNYDYKYLYTFEKEEFFEILKKKKKSS